MQRWVTWYRAGGLAEVLRWQHGGREGRRARLTAAQEAALQRHAEAGAVRSIGDGVHWVAQEYQVTYTYWGMRRVFARLGLRSKVPRSKSPGPLRRRRRPGEKGVNHGPAPGWLYQCHRALLGR